MRTALDAYIALEDAGWKGSAGARTSLQHDTAQRTFYESLMANASAGLNPCVAIMRLEGKPVAVNLCTLTGDTLWMLKITYADDLQEHSPGNLILLYLLDHFAEQPDIKYISFITGGEWTWRWGPERQPVHHAEIFASSPVGHLLYAARQSIEYARRLKHRWIEITSKKPEAPQQSPNADS